MQMQIFFLFTLTTIYAHLRINLIFHWKALSETSSLKMVHFLLLEIRGRSKALTKKHKKTVEFFEPNLLFNKKLVVSCCVLLVFPFSFVTRKRIIRNVLVNVSARLHCCILNWFVDFPSKLLDLCSIFYLGYL